MKKPPHRAQGHRNRAGRAAARLMEPGCVVCGGPGAPLCSPRCERRLDELGGAAKAAVECEEDASRAALPADARAWRELAARLRAIAEGGILRPLTPT